MRRVHYNGTSFDINSENYYDSESLNPESVKYVIESTFFCSWSIIGWYCKCNYDKSIMEF